MKKKGYIIAAAIICVLLLAFFGINKYIDSIITKTNIEEETTQEEIQENIIVDETEQAHEVVNFMVVGADNLDRKDRYKSYVEQRSDIIKLLSLDYTDKKVKVTSLNRDIVAWIPDKEEYGRLNWAYSFGGPKYALNTINYNLDLDVTKYVSFSFAGFINVIDKLGGIDLELTKEEVKLLNDPTFKQYVSVKVVEGTNHLLGKDVLTYTRIKKLDTDFDLVDRQNKVIKAVIDKLKALSFKELIDIVNVCLPYVTTNLTSDEIKQYALDIITFDLEKIETQEYPKENKKDVALNKKGIGGYVLRSYSNQVIELHKYLYGTDTYEPTQKIYDNEKKTYEEICEFYEGSELIPN